MKISRKGSMNGIEYTYTIEVCLDPINTQDKVTGCSTTIANYTRYLFLVTSLHTHDSGYVKVTAKMVQGTPTGMFSIATATRHYQDPTKNPQYPGQSVPWYTYDSKDWTPAYKESQDWETTVKYLAPRMGSRKPAERALSRLLETEPD